MKINGVLLTFILLGCAITVSAQSVDYSVVSVPEESGLDITQVTAVNDYVCMPVVQRNSTSLNWYSNKIIDVSIDGKYMAYLSFRNNTSNIFIKELGKQGGATQRTNRQSVLDFSYSPDGEKICFSENRGANQQIFITDAKIGYVCRQITSANSDYSPVFTPDMKQILFARIENNGTSIWSYNTENNYISSYTSGMNPCPTQDNNFLCARVGSNGRSEIWRVNYATGVEECVVADPARSFTSPVISPDGEWILFTGESVLGSGKFVYRNTDIFVCKKDGSEMIQITYHAADDLSPTWSRDGRYIYFISQRGNAEAKANIWRISFQYN